MASSEEIACLHAGVLSPESPECVFVAQRDWRLAHLIDAVGELNVYQSESAFSNIAHSIIEQMMSMKVARTIDDRVRALCGGELSHEGVSRLTKDQLRSCGMSGRKADSLLYLANNTTAEQLEGLRELNDHDVSRALCELPGVGKWTADMFLIFYLMRSDVVPDGDATFVQAFTWLYGAPPAAGVVDVVCDLWHPYASVAARYLYRALDTGMVKAGSARKVLRL